MHWLPPAKGRGIDEAVVVVVVVAVAMEVVFEGERIEEGILARKEDSEEDSGSEFISIFLQG